MFFFFNDTATTEIYTLSLHDALPISQMQNTDAYEMDQPVPNRAISYTYVGRSSEPEPGARRNNLSIADGPVWDRLIQDRKSTRLNSSHTVISYAVFCLKKKKKVNAFE